MLVGVDFDNTIVSYDQVFHREALAAGLIDAELPQTKLAVRQQIWDRYGDIVWQRLQGQIYGPKMSAAQMIDGALDFFRTCYELQIPTQIISHKTEYGHFDDSRTSLRQVALQWLEAQGFFAAGTGLQPELVSFENTRSEKIARINASGCSHFIDDLPEVLLDRQLSEQIRPILFAPAEKQAAASLFCCCSWEQVSALICAEAGYE